MGRVAVVRALVRGFAWVSGCAGLLLVGCGDPVVTTPEAGFLLDGPSATPPPKPRVDPVVSPIPYVVVTLRGIAPQAVRVLVEGVPNPPVQRVLGDGTFCVDVPIPRPGLYTLRVRSQSQQGLFSEPSDPVMVEFDPAAPVVPGAATCSGSDPAGCPLEEEICDNGYDDDCNTLVDEEDPACAPCRDDVYEPNDSFVAPQVEPGRHDGLVLCPGDEDYYGVFLYEGERLQVRLFFRHAEGDLQLEVLAPDGASLGQSTSETDDESLQIVASSQGRHVVRVWRADAGGPEGTPYVLQLDVAPGG